MTPIAWLRVALSGRLALASLLLFTLSCGSCFGSGHKVPDLSLKDTDGHSRSLKRLRGNIVVLNFWATWCGPCQEELPRLSRLSESYTGKPVKFVLVSIDEKKKREEIAAFLSAHGVHLDAWTGATTDTMARFELGDIIPATIILDEQGEAVTRISGEAQEKDVLGPVDWLLAGRRGPAPAPSVLRRLHARGFPFHKRIRLLA